MPNAQQIHFHAFQKEGTPFCHKGAIFRPEIYNYKSTINAKQFKPSAESIKTKLERTLVSIITLRVFVFLRKMREKLFAQSSYKLFIYTDKRVILKLTIFTLGSYCFEKFDTVEIVYKQRTSNIKKNSGIGTLLNLQPKLANIIKHTALSLKYVRFKNKRIIIYIFAYKFTRNLPSAESCP